MEVLLRRWNLVVLLSLFIGGCQMDIKVRFTNEPYELERHGAWIDLRAAKDYEYKAGDFMMIDLGVNIQFPKCHEGLLVVRSSTFKKFGIIQTNAIGIIEDNYCGNDDVWMLPAYALKDGKISKGDRICQFRVHKAMEDVNFNIVDDMGVENRGGWGSTGR